MFSIRYTAVRPILAFLALALLAVTVFAVQSVGAVVGLSLLLVATILSWIYPPGIFGWLLQGTCPFCGGHVTWEVKQMPEPYFEVISAQCDRCGRHEEQFAYRPQ